MKIPNIKLSKKGMEHDYETFKEIFEGQFNIHNPKVREKAMKESYEKLTGKKVGNPGISKKSRKADAAEIGSGNVEDHKEE